MRGLFLFAAATAAFGISLDAGSAADLPAKAPIYKAAAPSYDWTGFYGGYNVGVGLGQVRSTSSFIQSDIDGAGFAGGVQGGYNWQFNPNWVAGIEADIGYLGIDRTFPLDDFVAAIGVKTNWYSTVRGRLGYTNGPSLFYVTGGGAFMSVRNDFNFASSVLSVPAAKSEVASGWTAGAGIETLLGGNWSAKAEYLYIDAGSQSIFNPEFGASARFDNRFHVFRYGLNYKFGDSRTASAAMPSHDWGGFYAGLNAGAGLSQIRAHRDFAIGPMNIADAGFTTGVQAGYTWLLNPNWFAGIEADTGYLGINRSLPPGAVVFGIKTDRYDTIRGRLGYSTGPALLYATGGLALVDVKNNLDFPGAGGIGAEKFPKTEIASGWTLGGGIEAALAGNWTAKTEYLYIDAGHQDVSNSFSQTAHFDNRFHVFRFGLNYKFGG